MSRNPYRLAQQLRRFTTMIRNALCAALIPLCALFLAESHAAQVTTTWIGGVSNWNTGANWSGSVVPNNGVDTFNVLIDGGSGTNSAVSLNISSTIDNLTIDSGDSLGINSGLVLTLNAASGSSIANSGTLSINASSGGTFLTISNGTATLSGGGSVILSNNNNNFINGSGTAPALVNQDNTISGAGNLGQNLLSITNQSLINATSSTLSLTIDPNASGVTNTGTLRGTGAGGLRLEGGTFTNVGGTIEALTGSKVELSTGAVINGGTFATSGTGQISAISTTTLDGSTNTVLNSGTFNVSNAVTLGLLGTINNTGNIGLNAVSSNTFLSVNSSTVTLDGSGTVTMGNNNSNHITGSVTSNRLINTANHTIQGAGSLGLNSLAVTNQGLINATSATVLLTIDPSSSGFTNTGILRATGAAGLRLQDATFTNVGGTIEALNGSKVELSTGATIEGGTLTSSGSGQIRAVGSMTLDGSSNTILNSGTFNVNNAVTVGLLGTINNTGAINLNSSSSNTFLSANSSTVTLDGSGTVTMGNNNSNHITGSVNTNRLINTANHTIQGGGSLGLNSLAITNEGLILGNSSIQLSVNPSASGFINTGIMRATSSNGIRLQDGTFTNVGGLIEALTGSKVELSTGTVIEGGTLSTTGTGQIIAIGSSTLDGSSNSITLDGTMNQNNAVAVSLKGTLINNGTYTLNAAGSSTDVSIASATAILDGSGTLTLGNNSNNRITGTVGTNELTNKSTHTIQGAGQIGVNLLKLVNQGTITANQSNSLTINPSSSGAVNTGLMQAVSGATLILNDGVFTNTGGTIRNDASTVQITSSTVNNGTIEILGSGEVQLNSSTVDGGIFNNSSSGIIRSTGSTSTIGGTLNNPGSGQIIVNNATTLSLLNTGTFTNDGSILINGGGSTTTLQITGGNVTLGGSGTVTLANTNSRIIGSAATNQLTINAGQTIQGLGSVGSNALAFNNKGLINGNNATNTLTIDPSATGFINTGTLRGSGAAGLLLQDGTFTNTGGVIEALTGSKVDLNNVTIAGGTFTTSGTGQIRTTGSVTLNLTPSSITNSGTFNQSNANAVNLSGGTLINDGTYNMNASSSNTNFNITGSSLTLSGTGQLIMSNSTSNRIIAGTSGNQLINASTHTIRGAGNIGANSANLNNQGLIIADQSNTLTIDPNTTAINTGTLRATGSGGLLLTDGTFTNTGGLIEALTGSKVDLNNAILIGGTLATSGTGQFRATGAVTFNGSSNATTNTGIFNQPNALAVSLSGTLINNGTFNMNASSSNTNFTITSATATLDGTGILAMTNSTSNRIVGSVSSNTFIHGTTHTIEGSGALGADSLVIQNQGTISANQSNALTVDPSAGGLSNTGIMQAISGGTLTLTSGTFNNTGGVIQALNGSTVNFTGVTIIGGLLHTEGSGVINITSASTLDNTSLGSVIHQSNGTSVTFNNTFTNDGDYFQDGSSFNTDILLGTTIVTFDGAGTLHMNGPATNRIRSTVAGRTFVNGPDHTIVGGGLIGNNEIAFTNQGTVSATLAANNLTIDPDANGASNTGTLTAANSAVLRLQNGNFTSDGLIEAVDLGRVEVNNAPVTGGAGQWVADAGKLQIGSQVSTTGNITIVNGGELELNNIAMTGHDLTMDNSTNILDVNGTSGSLRLSGSVSFAMTDETLWQWETGTDLTMTGGVGAAIGDWDNWENLEIGGLDLGTDPANHVGAAAGFVDNFHLEELVIGVDGHIVLKDLLDNGNRGGPFGAPEALYVKTLTFADSTGLLNLAGLHIYFQTLNGNLSQIIDEATEVPTPATLLLFLVGLLGLRMKAHARFVSTRA